MPKADLKEARELAVSDSVSVLFLLISFSVTTITWDIPDSKILLMSIFYFLDTTFLVLRPFLGTSDYVPRPF